MKRLPWWAWAGIVAVVAAALGAGVLLGRGTSPGRDQELAETTSSVEPAAPAEPGQSEPPNVSPEPTATRTVRVYLARGEYLGVASRTISDTPAIATAAVKQLLLGPTSAEQQWGLSTQVPQGTRLLGLTIDNGTARVDLSKEFETGGGTLSATMRLAQVVYTITQFPSVQRVVFLVEGKQVDVFMGEGIMLDTPQTRANFEYVMPAIFVEGPTPGERVTSPIHLWGTANTFEASFIVRIDDANGNTIVEGPAQATSGTGTRGTFALDVIFPNAASGPGSVVVYESSMKDGSEINVVTIPVTLGQ